ncbi:amino acid--tRNA ligase-related protein [Sorangium sp. So ce1099]|uniref:amino acid--tRNA ligase-related protein n=1 Tax=Sorangium sp. So ce1099 TaxID=3133331 RepID=UPI003F63980E
MTSSRRLHGRILETWQEGALSSMALIAGAERHVVRGLRADAPLAPGDIVEVELGDGGAPAVVRRAGGPAAGAWDPGGDALRWRQPGRAPSRMALLFQRQAILRAVREYFFEQGFLEVQAPLLVKGACPDAHLSPMRAEGGYLTTSTEYQIKRMIVGGFEKVFTLTQNFRGGDVGARHNPEFTMLEWARAFAPLDAIEDDVEAFVQRALDAVSPGAEHVEVRGRAVRIAGVRWERLTVREALAQHLGVHVDPSFSAASLRAAATRPDLGVPERFLDDPPMVLSMLLDRVTEHLGHERPVFLREWPALMTSSAELSPGSAALALRSELFIAGMELSDGFPSLRDPEVQAAMFARENARRAQEGKAPVGLDARYVEALRQGIPPGAGMALGFDRLVMLLTGQEHIRDVLAFTWDEL